MKSRNIVFSLLLAASSANLALAAHAGDTFHPADNEAGSINHVVPGKLTRAERLALDRAPAVSSEWVFRGGDTGYELRQHAYALSKGRIVHADDIPHDTKRPRFDASEAAALDRTYGGA